jgi:uncharacterized protein (TIGR03437 family)
MLFAPSGRSARRRIHAAAFLGLSLFTPALMAQRSRIDGPIDARRRISLPGHLRPQLRNATDEGLLDPGLELSDVTLVLRPSAAQRADLDQLLREQQDPASPNYHRWVTPEQYAEIFGASPQDIGKIARWLQQQNLEVTGVARARNSIQLRGAVAAVSAAFGTQLHNYRLNGVRHFANATEPSIPAELDVIVSAIEGLDDFHLEPRGVKARTESLDPNYTSSSGRHYLAPDDLAIIYNIKPLFAAGLDGSGQTIAVAGQSALDLSDVRAFKARFSLATPDPDVVLVPGSRDPGVVDGDSGEANLDLQWAGAVARNAHLIYVYAPNVMSAVRYAIDQNLAMVISVSYGACEPQTSTASLRAFQSWARQANAQGMTWVNASGDSGGADCGDSPGSSGLAVDAPSSVPEITGVGGTTLTEGSGTFWNTSNDSNGSSVLSYIPEVVWNDSSGNTPAAGGGGASAYFTKPSWQTGNGVPDDGARDVPDISLAASANHNGYMVYTGGSISIYGGTSAGTPVFAGVLALLNQQLTRSGASPGLGNINSRLYALAQTSPEMFHDVTSGNNRVTISCRPAARLCSSGTFGYDAAAGYDLASGLGSIDAYKLVTGWQNPSGALSLGTANMTLTLNSTSIGPAGSAIVSVVVSALNGGIPLGTVSFRVGSAAVGTAVLAADRDRSVATFAIAAADLAPGLNTIVGQYSGDGSYAGTAASTTVTLAQISSGPPAISGLTNAASYRTSFAPGMLLSIFGSQLAPATWSAQRVPLPAQMAGVSVTINGLTAPLLYVSPSQLNLQIPYEIALDSPVTVVVNNNGQTATGSLTAASTAPGIFVDSSFGPVPNTFARPGDVITLFVTGAGAVAPSVPSGAAPDASTPIANLPKPQESLTVTVGGLPAAIQFVGIPAGLVGVLQINYQVPQDVSTGPNQVIVQIGNAPSAPAILSITR